MLKVARDRDAALEGRRILLVEDDVRNIFALSSLLEPKGAKVEIARNGSEAVDLLRLDTAPRDSAVDLVLMDVMMPEMDGLDRDAGNPHPLPMEEAADHRPYCQGHEGRPGASVSLPAPTTTSPNPSTWTSCCHSSGSGCRNRAVSWSPISTSSCSSSSTPSTSSTTTTSVVTPGLR